MIDEPIAFFITWTVYGTFLPGDSRGWMKYGKGRQTPRPFLADWNRDRLKYPVELLSDVDRDCLIDSINKLGEERGWMIWDANPRTNHVHVVVTAPGYSGDVVRDQLKARCTRDLRLQAPRFRNRTVWTRGGDWKCIFTEEELETCILYVGEVQERKGCDEPL